MEYHGSPLLLFLTVILVICELTSAAAIAEPSIVHNEEDEVMALPDDVIIDALFTNIDTVQDQMELCEEGLRQKLVEAARGKLPYVEDFEDLVYKESLTVSHPDYDDNYNKTLVKDDHKTAKDKLRESDDKSTRTHKNGADVDDAETFEHTSLMQHSTRVKLTHNKHVSQDRKRRSAQADDHAQIAEEDKQSEKHDGNAKLHEEAGNELLSQSLHLEHHQVSPTEAVVNRLSDRLEYLKTSLLDCYALYQKL